MKFFDYLKEQLLIICSYLLTIFLIVMLLLAFKCNDSLIIVIATLLVVLGLSILLITYHKKQKFYNELINTLQQLDQKYLITEIIDKPSILEGKIFYQALYEINKSMIEKMNLYQNHIIDFKDYVELWIHEVKIPLANLRLIIHNQENTPNTKILEQLKKLEDYIDQILYYVRSEAVEKDYLIKEYSLKKIVNDTIMKNKDSFLYHNINIKTKNLDYTILTDSKWLSFILNQIINNSIKYSKKETAEIIISAIKDNQGVTLSIRDNGIGIKKHDLTRVFEKSFTGDNGRICPSATGMGLYICQKLCQKLGHKISIMSKEQEFTEVYIHFEENSFYDVVK